MRIPRPLAAVLLGLAGGAFAAGPAGRLNDTGQTLCYDAADAAVACNAAGVGSDAGVNPRQDARFGRDPAQAAGQLPAKTGAGAAGFDFTKVCLSGDLAGQGSCAANPGLGDANPWACTRDNVTGLYWSVENIAGQTWAQAAASGGGSSIAGYQAAARCGFSTAWRLPTTRELISITHLGATNPAIDTAYFPGTGPDRYWSSDVVATDPTHAWVVGFYDGVTGSDDKTGVNPVRLVRGGP